MLNAMVKWEMLIELGGHFINSIQMHANAFKSSLRPIWAGNGSPPFAGLGKVAICVDTGADRDKGLTPDFTTIKLLVKSGPLSLLLSPQMLLALLN